MSDLRVVAARFNRVNNRSRSISILRSKQLDKHLETLKKLLSGNSTRRLSKGRRILLQNRHNVHRRICKMQPRVWHHMRPTTYNKVVKLAATRNRTQRIREPTRRRMFVKATITLVVSLSDIQEPIRRL
jgi:hypothetical protein